MFFLFFFFFQAEDGIRDRTVTGVQTCALPISKLARRCFLPGAPVWWCPGWGPSTASGRVATRARSEERREGKSVDLGGRRIIKKKKDKKRKKKEVEVYK